MRKGKETGETSTDEEKTSEREDKKREGMYTAHTDVLNFLDGFHEFSISCSVEIQSVTGCHSNGLVVRGAVRGKSEREEERIARVLRGKDRREEEKMEIGGERSKERRK